MRSAVTKKKQAQTRATECCVLFAMLPVRGVFPLWSNRTCANPSPRQLLAFVIA